MYFALIALIAILLQNFTLPNNFIKKILIIISFLIFHEIGCLFWWWYLKTKCTFYARGGITFFGIFVKTASF